MHPVPPSAKQIHAARAARQHLTRSSRGSSDADYLAILRELAPMRPPSYEFPGTPVVLYDRHEDAAGGSPQAVGERVRRQRLVFKGRFQGGRIAYVPTDELPLYLTAYRRPRRLTLTESTVLEALEHEGPLHKSDIAEVSGVKGRELSAALQKLQRAFLVYEQQLETEWDNAWFHLEREQPQWLEDLPEVWEARLEVLRRFTRAFVVTNVREAKEWSNFPAREVERLLDALASSGHLIKREIDGGGGHYIVSDWKPVPPEHCVAVLDLGDPLVTAQASALKRTYPDTPILKYLLIDGEIKGAVTGRWGINPFDIDDVIVPEDAKTGPVREEVIRKLRRHYPLPRQRILAYGGEPLDG